MKATSRRFFATSTTSTSGPFDLRCLLERFAEEIETAIAENARAPSEWLDLYPLIGFTERR